MIPVDKKLLKEAIAKYNKLPVGKPIPHDSYIIHAITEVVEGVAKKPEFSSHPLIEDMKSVATIAMFDIVVGRKMDSERNTAFAYLNTICRREFKNHMVMESGEPAHLKTEILGHHASTNPSDTRARDRFVNYANATKGVRDAYIKRKQRKGSRN